MTKTCCQLIGEEAAQQLSPKTGQFPLISFEALHFCYININQRQENFFNLSAASLLIISETGTTVPLTKEKDIK
jgi:hypothetical protein